MNRRVQTVFADGTTQTTWFDALGRRTHEQDQAGKVTSFGYSKHAEVTVPSLDDWEKEWQKNPQRIAQPKLLPVDFRPQRIEPCVNE